MEFLLRNSTLFQIPSPQYKYWVTFVYPGSYKVYKTIQTNQVDEIQKVFYTTSTIEQKLYEYPCDEPQTIELIKPPDLHVIQIQGNLVITQDLDLAGFTLNIHGELFLENCVLTCYQCYARRRYFSNQKSFIDYGYGPKNTSLEKHVLARKRVLNS